MKIQIYDELINISYVYRKNNRRFYIRYKDGDIIISGFRNLNEKKVLKLIEENKDGIYNLYKRAKANIKEKSSNTMHLFGHEYLLKTVDDDIVVEIRENFICVGSKYDEEKALKYFYTKKASEYISNRFDSIFCLYDELKIKPNLKFKYTNTFYGKCYPKKNIIQFSGMLMKYDPIFIDSVIHHEICHLKYLSHDEAFYNYYDKHFNNAKKIQHQLRMTKYNDKY